ncbi:MAG: family 10 glycosylhydrolase [Planctomycetota bacterium]
MNLLARTTRRLAAVALAAACATPALAADPEVRGTWMTTTANDAISTPQKTAESMKRLRDMGLNTVYVECWKNGYTEFPSATMDKLVGVPMKINGAPAEPQRDLLQETVIEAHRNGLVHIAWFEYGFMAAFKDTHNSLRKQYPEWMTTTRDGELVSDQNPFVWMNPLRPESRDLIIAIVKEAVVQYDLDGVQLDDRIAWPVTMGYDPYTIEVYKAEHNGAEPPADPRDPAWVQWRADKVSEFAERFHRELKELRPNLIVSISPAIWDWCLTNYACDWKRWSHEGLMDEYIPQIYRTTYDRVEEDWPAQLAAAGPDRVHQLIAGLRLVGEGPPTTWDDYRKKIELVRSTNAGGHCHWFSRGVLEVYPEELTLFYDVINTGHAAHPNLPEGWRPLPIVMEPDDQSMWVAKDVPAGDYRQIVMRNGQWSVEKRFSHPGGDVFFTDHIRQDAVAVELLVDRRNAKPFE